MSVIIPTSGDAWPIWTFIIYDSSILSGVIGN